MDGIAFGLPALNDPDEPLFMMLAYDMLDRASLDPQWFGHPGTITLYCLAAIMAVTGAIAVVSGQYAGIGDFAQAIYANPGIVILPARMFIAANGVACVGLTYLLGDRLWGRWYGLVAALLLSMNALHIGWSQVIRTDVQASVFMLACLLMTIAIYRGAGLRAHVLAGLFAGLACATKWPAAIVFLSPMTVTACLWLRGDRSWHRVLILPLTAGVTLLSVSPFLVLSFDVTLADLAGEARQSHPGATGSGFIGNLGSYLAGPLANSFGWAGLAGALSGSVLAAVRSRIFLLVVCPVFASFLALICLQDLWWERWLVPVLPFLALGLSWPLVNGLSALWRKDVSLTSFGIAFGATVLALVPPIIAEGHARSLERRHDTRQAAAAWIERNAPPGSTVLVEHAAFDLLQGSWNVKFPLGSDGCIDARSVLASRISATEVDERRLGGPIVDLGHVDQAKIESCRADFYVFSNFDRYASERSAYPEAYARYAKFVHAAVKRIRFAPVPGERGGPSILVLEVD
ncbi:ArnT family glycosyltransferase [Aurantiacibacter hainanensis]|uniref:ArnT family glycosyltransferase n=1 Tax=Aurantiacibacter hainanensis TaxID=3076114 RepID=UPI0030C66900